MNALFKRQGRQRKPRTPSSMTMVSARAIAARVAERVMEDEAWISRVLDYELGLAAKQGKALNEADVRLCTEIAYGTLRKHASIDALLNAQLKRGTRSLDSFTLAILRTATYQLGALDRVPVHAVINESVEIIRGARTPVLAGVVNAVLRRISEKAPRLDRGTTDVPTHLREQLNASLGAARAAQFLDSRVGQPLQNIRALTERTAVLDALRTEVPGGRFELSAIAPHAILADRSGDLRKTPSYARGDFWTQEEGAQLVAELAGVKSGQRVADACAGHGGKSMYFAQQTGSTGRVVALDLYEEKLDALLVEAKRLGFTNIETRTTDLTIGAGGLGATFDVVVVDAPCSGFGTIHRRPELVARNTNARKLGSRIAELQRMQIAILDRTRELVRPGGTLVYAVCSPLHAEGRDVVARVLERAAGWKLETEAETRPRVLPADPDGFIRIGPWSSEPSVSETETLPPARDVYQVAVLRAPSM